LSECSVLSGDSGALLSGLGGIAGGLPRDLIEADVKLGDVVVALDGRSIFLLVELVDLLDELEEFALGLGAFLGLLLLSLQILLTV